MYLLKKKAYGLRTFVLIFSRYRFFLLTNCVAGSKKFSGNGMAALTVGSLDAEVGVDLMAEKSHREL